MAGVWLQSPAKWLLPAVTGERRRRAALCRVIPAKDEGLDGSGPAPSLTCVLHCGMGQLSSAPAEIRTRNLLIRSQALYPLSYGGLQLDYTGRSVTVNVCAEARSSCKGGRPAF